MTPRISDEQVASDIAHAKHYRLCVGVKALLDIGYAPDLGEARVKIADLEAQLAASLRTCETLQRDCDRQNGEIAEARRDGLRRAIEVVEQLDAKWSTGVLGFGLWPPSPGQTLWAIVHALRAEEARKP